MSELASYHEEKALEPDEFTLINALRNQDDIPILMDIVTDKEGADVDSIEQEFGSGHRQDESATSPVKQDDESPLVALINDDILLAEKDLAEHGGGAYAAEARIDSDRQSADKQLEKTQSEEGHIPVLTQQSASPEPDAFDKGVFDKCTLESSALSETIIERTSEVVSSSSHHVSQEVIASAIADVLEKRLPELVNDVLRVINERTK